MQLALQARSSVSPNPMVGAVLVYNEKIIGEGYHKQYASNHAEVNCINSVATDNIKFINESVLYISLEPCNHFGNTPPCVDLILKHKIKKVVVGCMDTFEKVNGAGIERLRAHGVDVQVADNTDLYKDINKHFFYFHKNKLPYVILKWAQTENNIIAAKNTKTKISNTITDRLVHKWRSEIDAIWVGYNTVEIDNPILTNRLWSGKNPTRIFFTRCLHDSILQKNICNTEAKTIIFNLDITKEEGNITFIKTSGTIKEMLHILAEKKIQSILVEGGEMLIQQFHKENLWNEARVIVSSTNKISSGVHAPTLRNNIFQEKLTILNDDIYIYKNSTILHDV